MPRRLVRPLTVLVALIGLCASASPAVTAAATAPEIVLPPAHAKFDYQIGGARTTPSDVRIVDRDREDQIAAGKYNVCYVNGFQTQPNETRFWRSSTRWPLVLKDRAGDPVVDSGWGEFVLDTRTSTKRAALAEIVGRWIDGCQASGFDAVEIDNLDSFSRSKGLISRKNNKSFAALLTARAHEDGLAIGQKNWPELGEQGPALGFDFAIAEECGQYDECAAYTDVYGTDVLSVEYTPAGFRAACAAIGTEAHVLRADRDVSTTGPRKWCDQL